MSVVISHMRAAATLDESARLIADHLRTMAEDVAKCPPSKRNRVLHRWAAKLEDAVEITNEERQDALGDRAATEDEHPFGCAAHLAWAGTSAASWWSSVAASAAA